MEKKKKKTILSTQSHFNGFPSKFLGVTNTANRERGTGNRERESGNECTAVIRIRIQNGGRKHGKGSCNQF